LEQREKAGKNIRAQVPATSEAHHYAILRKKGGVKVLATPIGVPQSGEPREALMQGEKKRSRRYGAEDRPEGELGTGKREKEAEGVHLLAQNATT